MKGRSVLVVVWLNGFEVLFELRLVVVELVLLREFEGALDDSEHVLASLGSNVGFYSDVSELLASLDCYFEELFYGLLGLFL